MTTKPTERMDVLAVIDLHMAAMVVGRPSVPGPAREFFEEAIANFERARAAVAELVEAADKAKAALLTGQIGHINAEDVGVYHLDGITCGNALNALRAALARIGVRA